QRLGPPEAGIALLVRVLEQAGGDRLPRRGPSHEHDSPLVARDEGAAGGGRADGEGEEAITEGGVARHAIGIRAHRTLTSRPGRGDADRGGSYRGAGPGSARLRSGTVLLIVSF